MVDEKPQSDAAYEGEHVAEPATAPAQPAASEPVVDNTARANDHVAEETPVYAAVAADEPTVAHTPAASYETVEPVQPTTASQAETARIEPVASAPVAPAAPAAAETGPQVVYVAAPQPPRRKGNRGVGALLAVVASIVFAIVFAIAVVVIYTAYSTSTGSASFTIETLTQQGYYVPVIIFLVAFVLLVLIVNRGGWWAYIIGSILVALAVYFGTAGLLFVVGGGLGLTAEDASKGYLLLLSSPFTITAGLLAREVALWGGALISRRGKRVRLRNAENQAEFEREQAEAGRA